MYHHTSVAPTACKTVAFGVLLSIKNTCHLARALQEVHETSCSSLINKVVAWNMQETKVHFALAKTLQERNSYRNPDGSPIPDVTALEHSMMIIERILKIHVCTLLLVFHNHILRL